MAERGQCCWSSKSLIIAAPGIGVPQVPPVMLSPGTISGMDEGGTRSI